MAKVAVIMGSDSDFDVVKKCIDMLKKFKVEIDVRVISAHRNPRELATFAQTAEDQGYEVIIAAAGKAAHLPGVIAGSTPLPVIGIPIKTSLEGGMDSLFSIVQMPTGIPVATVAVNGAANAAILAVQILSVKYPELRQAIKQYKQELDEEVKAKNARVQALLNQE